MVEAGRDSTEVWVGGLPHVIGQQELAALEQRLVRAVTSAVRAVQPVPPEAEESGAKEVVSAARLHSRSNGEGLGYGFLWFATAETADLVVHELNEAMNCVESGNADLDGEDGADIASRRKQVVELLTLDGRILKFRAARGHPAKRAKPVIQGGTKSKPLLILTAVCFSIAESEADFSTAVVKNEIAAWRRLFAKHRISLDFRCFSYTREGVEGAETAPTDEFLRAALASAELACVWYLGGVRSPLFYARMQALARSECHFFVLDAAAEPPAAFGPDLTAQRVTHLRGLPEIEGWCSRGMHPIAATCLLHASLRRLCGLHLNRSTKVFVADCDNTLWGGAVAEDGVAALDVSSTPFAALQRRLAKLQGAGKLLCLASRNPCESVVKEVFETRGGEMAFTWEQHVTAAWVDQLGNKSEGLAQLGQELNLGLDSFVFLDDNPREVFEVVSSKSKVLSIQVPDHTKSGGQVFADFVQHHWALDVWPDVERFGATEEDRSRTRKYHESRLRTQFRRQFFAKAESDGASPAAEAAFLASLQLNFALKRGCVSSDFSGVELERVSQLSLRTNQMNTTQLRLTSAASVAQWLDESEQRSIITLAVSDRFGDYGMVCQTLLEKSQIAESQALQGVGQGVVTVVCFNMSCRVLGRGVEEHMLSEVFRADNFDGIRVPVVATARNALVRRFLERVEANVRESSWTDESLVHDGQRRGANVRVLALRSACWEARERRALTREGEDQEAPPAEHIKLEEVGDTFLDWSGLLAEIASVGGPTKPRPHDPR